MLMEYADGGTLREMLRSRRTNDQLFNSAELLEIFIQLSSGMKAINDKLVHRDIKPDNILLSNTVLKISDFGLSKVIGAATRSQTFKGINHVMHCAPEAWRLEVNLPSMDMYSMGITFYEIATLRHPFESSDVGDSIEAWKNAHFFLLPTEPSQFNDSLNGKLAQVIMKMMSNRAEDRYASWDSVIERLGTETPAMSSRRDVSSLVARAAAKHREDEMLRLSVEAASKKHYEQMDLLRFCLTEIAEAAQQTVDAFNEQSEFTKLDIKTLDLGFSIHTNKGAGALPTVRAGLTLANDVALSDGTTVRAWGTVKAPSGRGFNLLLVARGKDDIYGRWQTLHVSHNPIATPRDPRPEPFPFEIHELPKEIALLNAMHVYQTTKGLFQPDMLDPLLAELLEH